MTEYRETDNGIEVIRSGGDGELLCNFVARIVRDTLIDDGSGDRRRVFEISASAGGKRRRFEVLADQYASMRWVWDKLGANAIIFPRAVGQVALAIQTLSTPVEEHLVFGHTGWRKVGGVRLYLHAGGAVGAEGAVDGVDVSLDPGLANYCLPSPPDDPEVEREAFLASFGIVDLGPDEITIPLWAAIWRAPFGAADFSVALTGPTGGFKSELAARFQQHWGPNMDRLHLPGSWTSTANASEYKTFMVKDAGFVMDDFAPAGSQYDIARSHRDADRVLRGVGNSSGRDRMRADGSLRRTYRPRGMTVTTGEDVPRGESLRSRMLILPVAPGAINATALTAAQHDGAEGTYALALSGFLRWMASDYARIRRRFRKYVDRYRARGLDSAPHRRTPDIVANLAGAIAIATDYAIAIDALDAAQAKSLRRRAWAALGQVASAQGEHQEASEPAARFLQLLKSAMVSGLAHVASPTDDAPHDPKSWGWHIGTTIGHMSSYEPRGRLIGWTEANDVYLDPNASIEIAQMMGARIGETIPVSPGTLRRRLLEQGYLITRDGGRQRLTRRKTLGGIERIVMHLGIGAFFPQDDDQPAPDDTVPSEERPSEQGSTPGVA